MASIPFSDVVEWEPLPIDAQDIVTQARIVVAGEYQGNPASEEVAEVTTGAGATEYGEIYPWPVTHVRAHASHSTYQQARAVKLPPNYNPFLPETVGTLAENVSNVNITDPTNAYDGDPDTFATNASASYSLTLTYSDVSGHTFAGLCYGVRLRYELTGGPYGIDDHYLLCVAAPELAATPRTSDGYTARYRLRIGETNEGPVTVYMIAPFDARAAAVNLADSGELNGYSFLAQLGGVASTGGDLKVYSMHGLVLDTERLDALGDASLIVPAATPKRVRVGYHVPMDDEHTFTGWPGGDLTSAVAQQSYQGGETLIELERVARSLGLSALERAEAERVRRETFGLTMGSRR